MAGGRTMVLPGWTNSVALPPMSREIEPVAAALVIVATLRVITSLVAPVLAPVIVTAVVPVRVARAPLLLVARDFSIF